MQQLKHIIEIICHASCSRETGAVPAELHPNFWMY